MNTPNGFYALGDREMMKSKSMKNMNHYEFNNAYRDKASDILERNIFLGSSSCFDKKKKQVKISKELSEINNNDNNYLNIVPSFQRQYKFDLKPYLLNKTTLNNYLKKVYVRDTPKIDLNNGICLSNRDYKNEKKTLLSPLNLTNTKKSFNLSPNMIINDKNSKGEIIRHPKGFWSFAPQERQFNRESKDAPDTFQVITTDKLKRFNKELEKQETITLLSKTKNWITVTPKHKNRRKPLESIKVKNVEGSKILPEWMQPKYHQQISPDFLTHKSYTSIRNGLTTLQLVDKDNGSKINNKSIFSIGDFRHNVSFKDDMIKYQEGISEKPKRFFDWDDGKRYNPKKAKGNL